MFSIVSERSHIILCVKDGIYIIDLTFNIYTEILIINEEGRERNTS